MESTPFETATFALGWFWGPDSVFGGAKGVLRTRVGYAAGSKPNPTYHSIGDHTECFQVDFDPSITSFSEILQLFWSEYTPGKSYSKQYMSAILYSDDKQRQIAEEAIEKKKLSVRDVHVHFAPLDKFYLAEDYHQKYYLQNSSLFEKLKIPRNDALVLANSFMATRLNGYFGGHGTYELFLSDLKGFPVDESVKAELKETVSKRMKVPLRCE